MSLSKLKRPFLLLHFALFLKVNRALVFCKFRSYEYSLRGKLKIYNFPRFYSNFCVTGNSIQLTKGLDLFSRLLQQNDFALIATVTVRRTD